MSGGIEKIGWTLKKLLPVSAFRAARDSYKWARSYARKGKRAVQSVVTKQQLIDDLKRAGFGAGDVLMIHSSLSHIGNVEGGAQTVVDSLKEVVTGEGTLIMPSFSSADVFQQKMLEGNLVDLRTEPGVTGKVTEAFRKMPGVLRSSHPFSSICAWGKHADFVVRDHQKDPRVCHPDSPLARLLDLDAKIVGIGISLAHVSFYHVVEDAWDGFPFNTYSPPFLARYIDFQGRTVERQVMRYDPKVSATRIERPEGEWNLKTLTSRFSDKKILTMFRLGNSESWKMNARTLFEDMKTCATAGLTIYTPSAQGLTLNLDF